MLYELFKQNKVQDSVLRPIGAGLSVLYPLGVGLLFHNLHIAQFGILGAFSFLAFQRISIAYNLKAISIHGICILLSFILGMLSVKAFWIFPFLIAITSFFGFMVVKIYRIPKPAHFFVLMLLATGGNTHLISTNIFYVASCLIIGILSSIFNGLLISLLENLPLRHEKSSHQRLYWRDKLYVTIDERPKILLDALHFSFILFVAGYVAYLLKENFGHWVLISCAAVLAGEEIEVIKRRYLGRIVGSMIGLFLGVVLISLKLPTIALMFIIILLNILIEYFMPRNYTIANFFTNPLVLLLSLLTSNQSASELVLGRFTGVILGSVIAFLLISMMHKALRLSKMEY
ncbi:Fusaric acid resistance protein-like [Pilibacter termitis]|uniref:Fusaric acid resistance protein-like n=1 Tax=Pilibacter termitis TaxID=263852 RepID=A0A1T4MNV9_9ENTE|nr:FUSC family protein [Pilibacter termitis]SJZ68633.1 Fusaric acid resistance protein-like [Pilibacter termitis]